MRLLSTDGDNESCLVMQDIEGNEFCLDLSGRERGTFASRLVQFAITTTSLAGRRPCCPGCPLARRRRMS